MLNSLGLLVLLSGASLTANAHPFASADLPLADHERRAVDLDGYRVETSSQYGHEGGNARRAVDLDSYRVESASQYTNGHEISSRGLHRREFTNYIDAATALVESVAPGIQFRVVPDHYVSENGIAHVYFKQTLFGLDIDNADFNVNVNPDGTIFSYGNSFYSGAFPKQNPLKKRSFTDPTAALKTVSKMLKLPISGDSIASIIDGVETYLLGGTAGAQSDPTANLVFLNKDDKLSLTWKIETDVLDNWLLTYVDAITSSEIYGVVDYVSDATYEVYPWPQSNPTEGPRKVVTNPWHLTASEFTWHGDGSKNYTTVRGNNAIAQANPDGGNDFLYEYRPNSTSYSFRYPFDLTDTHPPSYRDASLTQLFYTSNMYHDILYLLGFNDAAGNFEWEGLAGTAGDFVMLNTQDGSGTNNANFATPADGQIPRMRMYIWTRTVPHRDSSFDTGVVIHEYTHGLSNRLTGGPKNSACLTSTESGGMGEGWSDAMANAIRIKPVNTRATNLPIGEWVSGKAAGIRSYIYSTSMTTNPHIYSSVNGLTVSHSIGERWASMLYEVMWNLVDKHGITDQIYPIFKNGIPTTGRFLFMKLVIDGMALQPCNPNFIQGRDAILDADRRLTNGANQCEIWKGFAKRGLGTGAVFGTTRKDSFLIPNGICK